MNRLLIPLVTLAGIGMDPGTCKENRLITTVIGKTGQVLCNSCARLLLLITILFATSLQGQDRNGITSRMIEVDDHQVHVRFAGLENRKKGTPIVVFEGGLSNSVEVWEQVLPEVAKHAPVVAYDRAGLGRSEWDNSAPTPQHVTSKLHRLLQQIGADPPYLLVGYSWGGALVRYFAGYYPQEVQGLVYVDPGPIINETLADQLAPFDSAGAGKAGYEEFWSGFSSMLENKPVSVKEEFRVMRELMSLEVVDRGVPPSPEVPVVVLVSAKPFPFFLKVSYNQQAHYHADVRHRIRLLQEWALSSPQGTVVVSNQTTHAVPNDDPELIIWAIQRVMSSAGARP